jgi:hypothetical protein
MANTTWKCVFAYKAKHKDIDSTLNAFVPVIAFSVKGGTSRIIDLSSTDDINLADEFLQARKYKNITLFLPPASNFEWLDLTEISIHRLPFFSVFSASGKIGQTLTHEFILSSKDAQLTGLPGKVTDSEKRLTLLRVPMALPNAKLTHGSQQGDDFVQEDW